MRNKAWRRKKDFSKAIRKRKLDLNCTWWSEVPADPMNFNVAGGFYKNLHSYSKNKIHCSCPMCSAKTKNKGNRRNLHGNYSPSINYKPSDKKKIDSMNYKINDYYNMEEEII